MQALIGLGSLPGLAWGGRAMDRGQGARALMQSLVLAALTLPGYSLLLMRIAPEPWLPVLLSLVMLTGAAALFARMPIIQGGIALSDPPRAPFLLGLNASAVFVGQSLGAALGGFTMTQFGPTGLGFVAGAVGLIAVAAAHGLVLPRTDPQSTTAATAAQLKEP